jgi:hypothetical protein
MIGKENLTNIHNIIPPKLVKRIHQLGIVVHDMSAAIEHFSRLGIGPLYRPISKPGEEEIFYHGKKISSKIDLVLGYCGSLQIELITTEGDSNIYSEFLERHGEGLHHVCCFVTNYDRQLTAFQSAGFETVQTGRIVSNGNTVSRYAYLDARLTNGFVIELSSSKLMGIIPVRMSPFMMKAGTLSGDLVRVA